MKKKIFLSCCVIAMCVFSLLVGISIGYGSGVTACAIDAKQDSAGNSTTISSPDDCVSVKLVSQSVPFGDVPVDWGNDFIQTYYLCATVSGTSNTAVNYTVTYEDGLPVEDDVVYFEEYHGLLRVGFYDRFDKTVVVTATSKANPNASATCFIDCYKEIRFDDYFVLGEVVTDYKYLVTDGSYSYFTECEVNIGCEYEIKGSYGVFEPEVIKHVFIQFSESAEEALEAHGYSDFSWAEHWTGNYFDLIDVLMYENDYNKFDILTILNGVEFPFKSYAILELRVYNDDTGNYESKDITCPGFYIGGFKPYTHKELAKVSANVSSEAGTAIFSGFPGIYDISGITKEEIFNDFSIEIMADVLFNGDFECEGHWSDVHVGFRLTEEAIARISEICEVYEDEHIDSAGQYSLMNLLYTFVTEKEGYTYDDVLTALIGCDELFYVCVYFDYNAYEDCDVTSNTSVGFTISGYCE